MAQKEFKHSVKLPYHDSLGLAVFNCGFQRCAAQHAWGPAVRDHYLIHYITAGKGSFFDGSETYRLSAGDGFLVLPSRLISYQADQDDPWEYYWVGFNGTDAARLIKQTGLSKDAPIFHYHQDDALRRLLLDIYNATGTRPSDEARMQAGLLCFLARLMDLCDHEEQKPNSGYDYIKKSLRFIDYNYSRDINVDAIAQKAGVSRSHLYRLFVQHLGMPPNEYLTQYRIQKAALLLKNEHLSVGETAYSTGFSDQLYFSRVFKKYKGVSPRCYAKQARAQQSAPEKP